ncbi:MAG TPA: glycosyltransferase [Thermomicrobiales bacterium]|nr:glycosyltransferase [Thermomicrobiales bacterium]
MSTRTDADPRRGSGSRGHLPRFTSAVPDRSMRVLMISKALVTGVYQKKLEELASHPDIELLAVVPSCWNERRVGNIRLARRFTEGYTLAEEHMRFNGRHHIHYYPGLAKHVHAFRPDLMHIDEEPYNLVTAHATRLARQIGARTIFFTWQNLDRRYPPPFSLFERYCYRHAAAALAGNEDARSVLRRKGFRGPVEVIPQFGVDPEIFQPPATGRDVTREFTIGYYGRLVPEKGIDTLIDAVALLDPRPRVIIVGSGERRPQLEARAAQRGLSGRVEFREAIPSDAIPALLAELDVVVVPSRTRPNWKEQFGRVIVESMACEVPVIGSDSGEIPSVIGDAGLVFPEGDASALAACVKSLSLDREQARLLGQAGRERVMRCYTQREIARATREVYLRVMDR